jgi:hypothetical protein
MKIPTQRFLYGSRAPLAAVLLLLLPLGLLGPTIEPAQAIEFSTWNTPDGVAVPADTPIYLELIDQVTSKRKETARGDIVVARVFRDLAIEGRVVVEEGTEVLLLVADVKKARFLGRKGSLDLEATAVRAVDGTEIPLQGLYTRDGKGRKVVATALTVAVAWPFLFLKGKNAVAPEGTVFEARVLDDAFVAPRPQVAEHFPAR